MRTSELWRYHRHIPVDRFTEMTHHLVDVEVEAAGNRAAIEATERGLDHHDRARHIAAAATQAEQHYRPQAIAAIEEHVAHLRASVDEQRSHHVRLHGCRPGCALLRGPRR